MKKAGKGKAAFLPLPIPEHHYRISAKEKSEFTTFGPSMADVFSDIPEGYTRNRIHPELRQKLEELADKMMNLLNHKVTRIVTTAPYLELTTMRQKEKNLLLVHLVNYDVTVDGIQTPVENVDLQICLPDREKIKSIRYSGNLSELKPLALKSQKANMIELTLPVVEVYGLLVIELGK